MRKPYLVIDGSSCREKNVRKPYLVSVEKYANQKNINCIEMESIQSIDTDLPAYWMVNMQDESEGQAIIKKLRQHASPRVYLRPIVMYNAAGNISPEIVKMADRRMRTGLSGYEEMESLAASLEPVNQWIEKIPDAVTPVDTNIAFRVLRLIASREEELEPVATVKSVYGYLYPFLSPLFRENDSSTAKTLDYLHAQHLLSGRFIAKTHCCGHCESAFLNFRETCPHCGTDDIKIEQLIHHFKCAHIGEMSTFKRDDSLVCPKCDNELRHIGVDYDKPSVVYQCNQCNHDFQDPKVMTTCYNCGRSNEPERQIVRTVQAYNASAIGDSAALFGMDSLFTQILEADLGLFAFNMFKDFYRIEASRISRYKISTSVLVMIEFNDIDKLYLRYGRRAREVFSELGNAFRAVLRESDVITSRNESIFCVIMTETDLEQAQRAVERLKENVNALLDNNLQYESQLFVEIAPVSVSENVDELLEVFLSRDVQ